MIQNFSTQLLLGPDKREVKNSNPAEPNTANGRSNLPIMVKQDDRLKWTLGSVGGYGRQHKEIFFMNQK